MNAHDVYLDCIILANLGIKRWDFPPLDESELKKLKAKESSWIQSANIYIENGKTVIELI